MKEFVEALMNYLENEAKIKKAQSSCESSWGYWLHDMFDDRDKLLKACQDSFVDLLKRGTI